MKQKWSASLVLVSMTGVLSAEPYAFELIVVAPNDPSPLGDSVLLTGVNSAGHVVGFIDVDGGDPGRRSFVWSEDSGFTPIGSPFLPALSVRAEGIDDSGLIAATVSTEIAQSPFPVARANTYDTGTQTWVEHHPWTGCSSVMQAMSEGGWFCGELADLNQNGTCGSQFFDAEAFVGNISDVTRAGTLGGAPSFAHDVNDSGDVCGEASVPNTFITSAYITESGSSLTTLPGLGGSYTTAFGMNNNGVLVGEAWPLGDQFNFAVKWTRQNGMWHITSLDPGDLYSVARDVNDLDNIVGWFFDEADNVSRGAIWVDDEAYELDRMLVNPDPGVQIYDAFQISDTNWIIGRAFKNGDRVGVILKPVDRDTDGDGLLDSWEIDGIDANKDGTIDLVLPEGVDPMRKDLLVEIDVMAGAPFYQEMIDLVAQRFADAPVMNPDGSTGITAHFIVDDTDIPFSQEWSTTFVEFNAVTPDYVGTDQERADPNWPNILDARQKSFRYCAVVNALDDALGVAEGPGNQFMIGVNSKAGVFDTPRIFGSTFMHELGHNLGLDHGGHDSFVYKPNYVSCMNYNFDELVDSNNNPIPIDYSRAALPTINESSIDETAGFSGGPFYSDVLTFYGYEDNTGARAVRWVQLDVAMFDWNADGELESSVSVDLNWLTPTYPGGAANASDGQTLEGSDDWSRISLPIGHTGPFSLAQAQSTGIVEQSLDELLWLRNNLPDPPVVDDPCKPDLNMDGELDFFDINTLLMNSVDYNGDTAFDFFDISAFLQDLVAGCP